MQASRRNVGLLNLYCARSNEESRRSKYGLNVPLCASVFACEIAILLAGAREGGSVLVEIPPHLFSLLLSKPHCGLFCFEGVVARRASRRV